MASKIALRTTLAALRALSYVAPGRVGKFYARKFCTPARKRPAAWEAEVLARARVRGHFDGCAYAEWGEGPLIVLLHGWEGRSSQLARFVEPLTRAGYRVLAWDAPAHGGSDGEMTNLAQSTAAFIAFASAHGPIHGIVAHSFGGMIARLAVALGLEVGRLVQIASPARMQTIFDEFVGYVGLSRRAARAFQNAIEQEAGIRSDEIDRLLARPQPKLARALAIHCRDDLKVSIREAEELVATRPGYRLREVRGHGHSRILVAAEVIDTVRDFMGPVRDKRAEPGPLR